LGRRHKDQIKRLTTVLLQKSKTVPTLDRSLVIQLATAQISPDRFDGLAIEIEKMDMCCATAQTFDPDRASAAKQIQHTRINDPPAKDAEQCFLGAISNGSRAIARHRL